MLRGLGFLVIMLIVFTSISANSLLEDFEDGNAKNSLGQEWFYFSDVKDKGNSKILNSVLLPDGSYEKFSPGTPGFSSGYCGRVDFILGDTSPELHNCTVNFIGIGTDIAVPGHTFDMRNSRGISFYARGTSGLTLSCEFVTSNVLHYSYPRVYVELSKDWQCYTVHFSDSGLSTENSLYLYNEIDLTKIQKITWKVFDNVTGFNDSESAIQQSGFYEIDNLFIIDDNTGISQKKVLNNMQRQVSPTEPAAVRYTVNLTGRSISPINQILPAGVYLRKSDDRNQTGKAVLGISNSRKITR